MKTTQIESGEFDNNDLLRIVGIKSIHAGWYTVKYNGVKLDASTIVSAKRNRKGEINQ